MAVRIAFSGLGFLGGWFAVDSFLGPPFSIPDAIAGAERLDGKEAEEFERGIELLDDTWAGDVDGGLYSDPPLVFYVIALDAPTGGDHELDFRNFIEGFQSGAGTIMSVETEEIVTTTEAGVTYLCAPVDAGTIESGICMWRDGEVAGVVQTFNRGTDGTRSLAAQAHAAVQD